MTDAQIRCEYPGGQISTAPGCVTPEVAEEGIGTAVTAQQPKNPDTLPFTGGDVTGLGLIGLGAVLVGIVVQRRSRARRKAAA